MSEPIQIPSQTAEDYEEALFLLEATRRFTIHLDRIFDWPVTVGITKEQARGLIQTLAKNKVHMPDITRMTATDTLHIAPRGAMVRRK